MTEVPISESERPTLRRNNVHYCETVVFQVEDELFRVPKENFETHSEVFKDMFALPEGSTNPANSDKSSKDFIREGTEDSHPIVLDSGVTKEAFSALCDVFYPRRFNIRGFYNAEYNLVRNMGMIPWGLDFDRWAAVHQLADMWMMEDIRQLAFSQVTLRIQNEQPCWKVIHGRKHKREDWVLEGYKTIIEAGVVSDDEVSLIGASASVKILQMLLNGKRGRRYENVESELKEIFKEELDDIRRSVANGEGFPSPWYPST